MRDDGPFYPRMVRLGVREKVRESIVHYYIDNQVTKAVGATAVPAAQAEARVNILDKCDIIFSTLGSVGSDVLPHITHVIVDESTQAVEPEALVPLFTTRGSVKSFILLGDPCQLPATLVSKEAEGFGYGQSLMERLMKANYPHIMVSHCCVLF